MTLAAPSRVRARCPRGPSVVSLAPRVVARSCAPGACAARPVWTNSRSDGLLAQSPFDSAVIEHTTVMSTGVARGRINKDGRCANQWSVPYRHGVAVGAVRCAREKVGFTTVRTARHVSHKHSLQPLPFSRPWTICRRSCIAQMIGGFAAATVATLFL